MTVLYLPITNEHEEETAAIPYNVVQDLLMIKINEMNLENDRGSQRKIS
jgi:hypothetical protein